MKYKLFMNPQPFEIEKDQNGTIVATDGQTIVATNCDDAIVMKRRAVKMNGGDINQNIEIVYVDVGGIRTYVQKLINGNVAILVTREDVYP